ncbi:MAG: DSD1 family PLP-dependent enzyme [Verrucomicrobia bacterium]|nr:DSD1 family PLP-dependent enzyme [Verrucomicrobiota bacterium]
MTTSRRTFLRHGLGLAAAATPALFGGTPPSPAPASTATLPDGRPAVGLSKHDLPTPALVLDLDVFERNLAKMAAHAKAAGIALRPHAKTHKCVEVARRQIAAGALGVCVATIREAEALAAGGIRGLLITSEMVGPDKIRRLLRVTAQAPDTMSVVDDAGHAEQLSAAARSAGLTLNLLLDLDPGSRRTGIAPGEPAKALARTVARLPHLRLRGIHCYSGSSAHVVGFEARRVHSEKAMAPAIATWHDLRRDGLPLEILSGGSTGTYNIDPAFGAMTELQVGSYVFMDVDYRRIGGSRGPLYDDFGAALRVIATVISKTERQRATVDAGFKAFATDRKFGPELLEPTGAVFSWGGDEHGILDLKEASREVARGDRLEFIVPHCDPNVNLHDRLYCLRGEHVEAVWPVARGYG